VTSVKIARAVFALVVAACGHPSPTVTPVQAPAPTATVTADAAEASEDEKLAAIQKAMNELSEASQGCWAAAAVDRFDIEGELAAQIEIGQASAQATILRDTARTPKLTACLVQLLDHYGWAPPLHGQTIQLPFKFRAPDGQSVIDRRLVPFTGQGKVSVAVLLDEMNTGNPNASMFEIAIAAGGTTALRKTERAELWYFLGSASAHSVIKKTTSKQTSTGTVSQTVGSIMKKDVSAGDVMFVPAGAVREISTSDRDVHAVIIAVPGGREGAARTGAMPTPEAPDGTAVPIVLSKGSKYGPVTIYAEPATIKETTLAASILELPAGGKVPEHVHAKETEMLYILEGSGTMTIAGTDVALTPTSVVQIPPNTKHAFVATDAVRALQIYTPAGPEQRFKAKP
jgi:quercetin dioxygenase-like cupin family protein